ncbi:MAG: glycosyl transferase, group 1 [Candidatus Woesebacteria bacterium GW2011_GWB1_39_12]|uniref:Glycosyl transferase, group 1 n=2 Tax=Candidatus Woeseibacteriota TaxID=1752722 RepID=A0A0G0M237_9BACT|nr:MAG: glycosyl transferase, group 1 [Candidatus Woesebacteria bacterium GW2011_GWA1_39_12]KKR00385.1 MAG: glycosyl transferase, group 1 [Candidatus Woesebacteria bacterium GW2011_GWB1_39_12]
MKLLIDARMYGLEHSGIGRYIINLIEGLKKLGNKEQFVVLLRKKYFDQLNLPSNWKKVLANFRHYTFEEQFKIPGIIKKERPDLVHFPHINFPILYRGMHVITVHDLTMQRQGISATTLPLPVYYLKRLPFLLASRIGIKSAVAIITPSDTVKNDVSEYYNIDKNNIFVTYEGVDFGKFENHLRGDPEGLLGRWNLQTAKYFLYVGNAYPHKNLGIVVKAIKKLNAEKDLNIKLAIAGSKDVFKERLQNLVRQENAEKYVKTLGYASDEELSVLYKSSIAFVYPSLSEGFGLQGLEAIASGSLVIASDIPVFKEIYEENVLYFNPNDVNSLVEAMKKVMKISGEEKTQMISRAKDFIKKYSWQEMAKETLEIYKQILEKK